MAAAAEPEACTPRKKTGGRQKGVKNVKTRLREQRMVQALIVEHLAPEDVASLNSLAALRHILRTEMLAGDFGAAKVTANMIAPYENAKLSASDMRISGSLDTKSDADIAAELAEVQAKLAAAKVLN
jgi:hypothetical protein